MRFSVVLCVQNLGSLIHAHEQVPAQTEQRAYLPRITQIHNRKIISC